VTLAHHRGGSGPPLLLLHGTGSQWQVWKPLLAALEREREVVAVDTPGFGDSPPLPPHVHPDPEALTDAVEAFMDAIGWQTAHVAGHSLGGWMALALARRGRTRSVYALAPAGFWNRRERAWTVALLHSVRRSGRALDPVADRLYRHAAARALLGWTLAARPWKVPPDLAVSAARTLARNPGFEAIVGAYATTHFTGAAAVPPPVTVAWGTLDVVLPVRQVERVRRAIPHARIEILPRCGHAAMQDEPERVAAAMLAA
jgi:pimeloyl-ACP methyl ester carboxylesterase